VATPEDKWNSVSILTLGVADLKRSSEFYERLGWRRSVAKAEGIVFFQARGMALALYPRHELAKDANVPADGDGFRGMSLAYNARNRAEVTRCSKRPKPQAQKFLSPLRKPSGAATRVTSRIQTGFYRKSRGIHSSRWQRTEVFGFLNNLPFQPAVFLFTERLFLEGAERAASVAASRPVRRMVVQSNP
jgi:hypothetical protein